MKFLVRGIPIYPVQPNSILPTYERLFVLSFDQRVVSRYPGRLQLDTPLRLLSLTD